uniref:Serpin peptidase inhibitor, clade E (nexin, plasminogen activator inhibitor type 1), member 3 n=1 Tax=Amphiprion percula TaxID=161767 RepID=A0A3P8TQ19_AMPPE
MSLWTLLCALVTGSDQRYTVLELPFLGRSLSLQVLLPSERKTLLSSLEAQLTQRHLASWDTGLRRTRMDIFLPRFRMQNKFNLRSVLPAMGISDAFNPTAADFTGISVEEGLYVSDAFHEVRIEVTEDGTKAAAATGMVLLKRSRAPVFKADRPFLFLLQQVHTGIYFTSYRCFQCFSLEKHPSQGMLFDILDLV